MKRIFQIVLNTFKTVSRRKMNAVLIFSVLTVSFTCSLFMLAMGNAEIKNREQNSIESRTLLIKISETDKEKVKSVFNSVNSRYEFTSYVITGKVTETVTEYSSSGTHSSQRTVYIVSDMIDTEDNYRWTLTVPKKIERGTAFPTGNEGAVSNTDEPKILNGKPFMQYSEIASHKYFKTSENKDLLYFLNAEDFLDITQDYTDFSLVFKETPDDKTFEDVLNIICGSIEVTDTVLPEKPSGMQVDRTKLFFAVMLLFISFTNIKSAFLLLCSSRKTEYKIYRKYGATKRFLAADVFGMIFIFSAISFIFSVLLYRLVYPLLSFAGVDYPINIFTAGFLFVAVMLMSCISARSCIKEVKKYEAR